MTEKLQLYRCEICGNLVEVILSAAGALVCCGAEMTLLKGHDADIEGMEKHVPVFETLVDGGREVRVGSVLHPMDDNHYITFIETISEDKNRVFLEYLYPSQEPKIKIEKLAGKLFAREFCSVHGLWEGESD